MPFDLIHAGEAFCFEVFLGQCAEPIAFQCTDELLIMSELDMIHISSGAEP